MIETIVYIVFGIFITLFAVFLITLVSWLIFENILEYKKSANKIVYLENLCEKLFVGWMDMLKILGIIIIAVVIILLAFMIAQIIIMVP